MQRIMISIEKGNVRLAQASHMYGVSNASKPVGHAKEVATRRARSCVPRSYVRRYPDRRSEASRASPGSLCKSFCWRAWIRSSASAAFRPPCAFWTLLLSALLAVGQCFRRNFSTRCVALGSIIAGHQDQGLDAREEEQDPQALLRTFSIPSSPPPTGQQDADIDMQGWFEGLLARPVAGSPAGPLLSRGHAKT